MNAQINIYLMPMNGSLNSGDSCYKYFALVCFKFVKYLDLKKKKKCDCSHEKVAFHIVYSNSLYLISLIINKDVVT